MEGWDPVHKMTTESLLEEAALCETKAAGRELPKEQLDRMIARTSSGGPSEATIKEMRAKAAVITKKIDAFKKSLHTLLDDIEKSDTTHAVVAPNDLFKLQSLSSDLAYMAHVADAVAQNWPKTRAKGS